MNRAHARATEKPRHERSALEDLRVLASLAELKEELGDSDAGQEIERALAIELQDIERKLRAAAKTFLHGAADEARLQAHLAVLEAHDRFGAVEPFLRMARASLTTVGRAQLEAALARMEIHDVVEERRRRAREQIARVERATEDALEKLSARIDSVTLALRSAS